MELEIVDLTFGPEIMHIKSENVIIGEFARNALTELSDEEFWINPVLDNYSTDCRKEFQSYGGQIHHTKFAFWLLVNFLKNDIILSQVKRKMSVAGMLSSVLLCDINRYKYGESLHGIMTAKEIERFADDSYSTELSPWVVSLISACVQFHHNERGENVLKIKKEDMTIDVQHACQLTSNAFYIANKPYYTFDYNMIKEMKRRLL